MRNVVPISPSAAFEQEVASRFRRDFPSGRIVHDFYVGEEQVDVLAVLPQGIFAIECKAYTGQIVGDANGPWEARTPTRVSRIAPHDQNPYHQALRKAFAVGDLLTSVLHANPLLVVGDRPWIYAGIVFPPGADLSTIQGLAVNPRAVLLRGLGRAIVFHPAHLSAYVGMIRPELVYGTA